MSTKNFRQLRGKSLFGKNTRNYVLYQGGVRNDRPGWKRNIPSTKKHTVYFRVETPFGLFPRYTSSPVLLSAVGIGFGPPSAAAVCLYILYDVCTLSAYILHSAFGIFTIVFPPTKNGVYTQGQGDRRNYGMFFSYVCLFLVTRNYVYRITGISAHFSQVPGTWSSEWAE